MNKYLEHLIYFPTKSKCINGMLVGSALGILLQVLFRALGFYG